MCQWCQKSQQEVGVEIFLHLMQIFPSGIVWFPKLPIGFRIVTLSICKKVVRNGYCFKSNCDDVCCWVCTCILHDCWFGLDFHILIYMWIACWVYGYSSKRNSSYGEWFGVSTKSSVASFSVTARCCLHVCYHIHPSLVSLSFLWGCPSTAINNCSAG